MRALKTLAEIKADGGFLSLYVQGLDLLIKSRLFKFLQEKGITWVSLKGETTVDLANRASWAAGYQECIDDILMFREKFLDQKAEIVKTMDFGALAMALERGDITQEEFDAIRSGKYGKYEADGSANNNSANFETDS